MRASEWLIVPLWLLCWLAFFGFPIALALAPLTPVPALCFLALYVWMSLFGGKPLTASVVFLEPPNEPALNLIHPHGIVCHGVHAVMVARASRRPVLLTTVWLAVYAMVMQYGWTSASVSAASISSLMRDKRDMWLYPGGFREAARHTHARDVVDVGSRGAIRLALRHGYPIRVAFAFGERKTAYNYQGLLRFRLWLAARGVPGVVPWLVVFGKSPVRVVVSRTLEVPLIPAHTDADVERWHEAYVSTLLALHAEHRGADDPPLVVVDCA
jgi:hypothetical protein